MVEDVCDSWEDMLDTGVLEKKLESIRVSNSHATNSSKTFAPSSSPATSSSGGGGVKILKRLPGSTQVTAESSGTRALAGSDSSGAATKAYDLTDFVNSEPFIPSGQSRGPPQITLEDNTRTQFKPSIKILKRETKRPSKEEEAAERARVAAMTQKSYEERAAEYAKARERILGSAGSDSPTSSPVGTDSSSSATSTLGQRQTSPRQSTNGVGPKKTAKPGLDTPRTNPEVPVVRQPQAPDGSRGFSKR